MCACVGACASACVIMLMYACVCMCRCVRVCMWVCMPLTIIQFLPSLCLVVALSQALSGMIVCLPRRRSHPPPPSLPSPLFSALPQGLAAALRQHAHPGSRHELDAPRCVLLELQLHCLAAAVVLPGQPNVLSPGLQVICPARRRGAAAADQAHRAYFVVQYANRHTSPFLPSGTVSQLSHLSNLRWSVPPGLVLTSLCKIHSTQGTGSTVRLDGV